MEGGGRSVPLPANNRRFLAHDDDHGGVQHRLRMRRRQNFTRLPTPLSDGKRLSNGTCCLIPSHNATADLLASHIYSEQPQDGRMTHDDAKVDNRRIDWYVSNYIETLKA